MDILITPSTVNHNGLGFGDVVFEASTQFNFFFHVDSCVRLVSCHLEGMNCLRLFTPATEVSYWCPGLTRRNVVADGWASCTGLLGAVASAHPLPSLISPSSDTVLFSWLDVQPQHLTLLFLCQEHFQQKPLPTGRTDGDPPCFKFSSLPVPWPLVVDLRCPENILGVTFFFFC